MFTDHKQTAAQRRHLRRHRSPIRHSAGLRGGVAHGDPPTYRYRIYEIPSVHLDPNDPFQELEYSRAFGINNMGQVVGEMKYPWDDSINPQLVTRTRAFVWLPNAISPSIPAGTHILSELFGGPSSMYEHSYANALNDTGLIVGETEAEAFSWNLERLANAHPEPSGFVPLYHCGTKPLQGRRALDVSNGQLPFIVGTMSVCVDCPDPPELPHPLRGFRHCYETGVTETLLPDGGACDISSKNAYINAVATSGLTVGRTGAQTYLPECGVTTTGPATVQSWPVSGGAPDYQHPDQLDTPYICPQDCCPQPIPHLAGGEAHGINDAGNIVGFVYHPDFPDTDVPRGWFWSSALHAGVDLPTLGITNERMIAYAIAEPFDDGRLQVVGRSVTQDAAVLWERDSLEIWTALKLLNDSAPLFCNGGDHKWTDFYEATDINDHGWIVGYGKRQGINGDRAFVLIPHHCPYIECPNTCLGDINIDGVVDVSDLLALLAAWGPVDECHEADLNNDGVVDVSDLNILLANWGPCPTAALGTIVPSHEQTVNDAGLHMDGWDAFVTVMQGTDKRERDNWNCWMQNYLSGCTRCPACPSSDPLVPYQLN